MKNLGIRIAVFLPVQSSYPSNNAILIWVSGGGPGP